MILAVLLGGLPLAVRDSGQVDSTPARSVEPTPWPTQAPTEEPTELPTEAPTTITWTVTRDQRGMVVVVTLKPAAQRFLAISAED